MPHNFQRLLDRYRRRGLNFAYGLHRWIGNRAFVTKVDALGEGIRFKTSSLIEYYARTRETYRRETVTMGWIAEYVTEADVVYDIGASIGPFSLLIAARMRSRNGTGVVYAFEPESQSFARLNENVILNDLGRHVLPLPLAVGASTKLSEFYVLTIMAPGAAGHAVDRPETAYVTGYRFHQQHRQGIVTMSLDDFMQLPGVLKPNHIKIDVDGFEGFVLAGMTRLLADLALRTIVIEIDDNLSHGQIEQLIVSQGFSVRDRHETPFKNGRILDVLFVRE